MYLERNIEHRTQNQSSCVVHLRLCGLQGLYRGIKFEVSSCFEEKTYKVSATFERIFL